MGIDVTAVPDAVLVALDDAITAVTRACMHDDSPRSGLVGVHVKLRQARIEFDRYVAKKRRKR